MTASGPGQQCPHRSANATERGKVLVLRSANVLEGFNTSPWWAVTTVAALQLETNRKAPHHFKEGGCVRPERKCLEGDMGPAPISLEAGEMIFKKNNALVENHDWCFQ